MVAGIIFISDSIKMTKKKSTKETDSKISMVCKVLFKSLL